MGNAPDRVEVLFKNAKRGSNRDFIKLSYYCIGKLVPMAFSLLADKELTIKFSTEALLVGREKIKSIFSGKQFRKIISKTTILRSVSYIVNNQLPTLTDDDISKLSETVNVKFSKIEREFLRLPSKERVLLLFSKRFKMDVVALEKFCINIPEKEIKEIITSAQMKLLTKIPSKEGKDNFDLDMEEFQKILKLLDDESVSELIDDKDAILDKYFEYLQEPMERLFSKVEFDKEILANLKSHIFEEIEHKKEESRKVKDKDVDNAKRIFEKYDAYERKTPVAEPEKFNITSLLKNNTFKNSLILIGVIIIVTIVVFKIVHHPPVWKVSSGTGTLQTELNVGEGVSTLQGEEKKITLTDGAVITVKRNSNLQLVDFSDDVTRFELNRGSVEFETLNFYSSAMKYIIKAEGVKVVTTSAHFIFTANGGYQYSIDVIRGWIEVEATRKGYCGNNYALELNPSQRLVIPYLKTETGKYINAVQTLAKNPRDNNAFNYILNHSEDTDALTLWHLLNIPSASKRENIIKKLNDLLLLEVPIENNNEVISREEKISLLNFIKSDLLMR